MRAPLVLFALVLVGCGQDTPTDPDAGADADATLADARGYEPRLCEVPTDLADPQVISGDIYQDASQDHSVGATVDLVADADGTILATALSDANGHFVLPGLANGGAPLPAHFRVTKPGYAPQQFYFVDGWRTMYMAITLYTLATHDSAAVYYGQPWDHDTGIVTVAVRRCDLPSIAAGLAGAVISFRPGPPVVYLDSAGAPVDIDETNETGTVIGFGVPAGTVAVDVDYDGHLTTADFGIEAGGATFIIYAP